MTDTSGSPRSGRRRLLVIGLASGCALVLVAALLVGTRWFGLWGSEPEPEAQPSPSASAPPSPFAGTPAEEFAEGAEGIELPPAEPVGDYTADQVQKALEQVREALIAARLDESMLVEHDPSGFLTTLSPDLRPAMLDDFSSADFAAFATKIAPNAELAPFTPRVAGIVAYDLATVERDLEVIEVTTRFVWVYPFEVGDPPGTDLVVVRDELRWHYRQGLPWTDDSQGLWLAEEAAQAWGTDCDVIEDGELLPDPEPAVALLEQAEAIFDPEQPLDAAEGC